MEDPMIDRAMKDWEVASADPQLRELYFDRKKAILDEFAAVAASRLNAERARTEGETKGKAEGEAIGETRGKSIMAQDAICQYLEAHLGVESQVLQERVRTIVNLDALSRIMNRIFTGAPIDEVTALIQDILAS